MTVKLNLTIDEKIVEKSKRFAARKKTTVSKLVQAFLKKQIEQEERNKKSIVKKWAGSFSGKLSEKQAKDAKENYLVKKYGK